MAIVAQYEYDPYGRIVTQSGFYAAANPFRWSTKRFDPETGLSDFGMRYYSATLGRWLNRDPIGDFGGANVYAYVGNNPTNRTDDLGLMWIPCPPGQPCHSEGPPYSYEPTGEEEKDKKACPGKRDLYQQSKPSQPTPPVNPCVTACGGYSDPTLQSACEAGCDAGRAGFPSGPTCDAFAGAQGRAAQMACEDGHARGSAMGPPPPPPKCPGYVTLTACGTCFGSINAAIAALASGIGIPVAGAIGLAGTTTGACLACIYCLTP